MKKSVVLGGLAGILLACLPLTSFGQKRQYVQGNVHEVKYEQTTEKDFPKYKLEEQCLFNNCYTFWNYAPRSGELNFWVSKKEEENMTFQEGKQVKIDANSYIPTKVGDNINVTELAIKRTSIEKLKRRAKERNSIGFSVDITDKDLKFSLPEQIINGTPYVILQEMLDNSQERDDLPFYLIPKTKGTKISFLGTSFIEENGYQVQAVIECDEKGGVFQPVPFSESGRLYLDTSKMLSEENSQAGIPEQQDTNKKTDYMKYREGLEKEQFKGSKLEKQTQTKDASEKKDEEYTLKEGDSFYNLADRFYGTGKDAYWIQKANPNINPSKLKVGQKIIIPKR
jgi:hypothetical protein